MRCVKMFLPFFSFFFPLPSNLEAAFGDASYNQFEGNGVAAALPSVGNAGGKNAGNEAGCALAKTAFGLVFAEMKKNNDLKPFVIALEIFLELYEPLKKLLLHYIKEKKGENFLDGADMFVGIIGNEVKPEDRKRLQNMVKGYLQNQPKLVQELYDLVKNYMDKNPEEIKERTRKIVDNFHKNVRPFLARLFAQFPRLNDQAFVFPELRADQRPSLTNVLELNWVD